ncbi:MAG: DUF881 domain-containing protein [Actinomycetota bacterium]|nr:DUF881 domain-containing protein [Actinomycetota bacterium]
MRRSSFWRILAVLSAVLMGLLFATTALTARGTTLRAGPETRLLGLIDDLQRRTDQQSSTLLELQDQTRAALARVGELDQGAAAAASRAELGAASAGLTALHGPGVTITLDDAPREAGGDLPAGARPDDVVIHQSDIQAVVNALWAAEIDAVMIMDERIVATSAVLCVGNTLLLHGRTYSPPYRIEAIGDEDEIRARLAESSGVALLLQAVRSFGLTFSVEAQSDLVLPAYDGPLTLRYAEAA